MAPANIERQVKVKTNEEVCANLIKSLRRPSPVLPMPGRTVETPGASIEDLLRGAARLRLPSAQADSHHYHHPSWTNLYDLAGAARFLSHALGNH